LRAAEEAEDVAQVEVNEGRRHGRDNVERK
jgi:hypothetical protein